MSEGTPLIGLYFPLDHKYFYHANRYSGQSRVRLVTHTPQELVHHIDSAFSFNSKTTMKSKYAEILVYIVNQLDTRIQEQSPLMNFNLYHQVPANFLIFVYDDQTHEIALQYQVRQFCPNWVPICLVRGSYIPRLKLCKSIWTKQLKEGRRDFYSFRACYFGSLFHPYWEGVQYWLQHVPFLWSYGSRDLANLRVPFMFAKAHNLTFDSVAKDSGKHCFYGELYRNEPIDGQESVDEIPSAGSFGRVIGYHVSYTKEVEALVPWKLRSIIRPFNTAVWLLSAAVLASVLAVGLKRTFAQEPVAATALAIVAPVGNYFSPSVMIRGTNFWFAAWSLAVGLLNTYYRNQIHNISIKPTIHLADLSVEQLLRLNYTLNVNFQQYGFLKSLRNKFVNATSITCTHARHMCTMEKALVDTSIITDGTTENEKLASFKPNGRSLHLVTEEMTASLQVVGQLTGLNILMTMEKIFKYEAWWIFRNMPNGDIVIQTVEKLRSAGLIEYWENVETSAHTREIKFRSRYYNGLGFREKHQKSVDGTLSDSLVLESFCILLYSICISTFVFAMEFFTDWLQGFKK